MPSVGNKGFPLRVQTCIDQLFGRDSDNTNGSRNSWGKAGMYLMRSIFVALFVLMLGSVPAWAALGESVSSVATDTQVLRGTHIMMSKVGFDQHQITMSDGSVVNEFVSPAGVVFGISWKGRFAPNLQQLLGTYMTNFEQGQRTHVIRRRALAIQGNDFVYTSVGIPGNFRGRAYAPSLVPANLAPEVVQ